MEDKTTPMWNGADKYHVSMTYWEYEIVCDLKNQACAWRKW